MKKFFYNMFYWVWIAVLHLVLVALIATFVFTLLAPRSVFAAPAAISANTAWGDVRPTKTLGDVAEAAGLATTQYVRKAAADALLALTNNFAANFTPLAAPLVTNLVEDVLSPKTMEFHYNGGEGVVITNGFLAPMFATSKVVFVKDDEDGTGNDCANLYSAGKRRNYSVLIDSLPEGKRYCSFSFWPIAKTHTIYAQPKLYTSTIATDDDGNPAAYSWDIFTNDVPCVITVREPDDKTLIVRRDRLNQDEVYLKLENGEAVLYTDGE